MMRIVFLSVFVLAVILNATMASPTNVDQQFTKAANIFATELYQKAVEGINGNFIMSPFSIQAAVSLGLFGATDGSETQSEMLRGLKYPATYSTNTIAENYKAITENVEKTNGLKIANKIFVMKDNSIKPTFQDVATRSFHSEAQSIDFAENQKAAATINSWVEDKTNNKIKDLIKADSLTADTRMVLVNAIHFKGFWKHQFDKAQTFKAPFFLNEVDSVDVDFMRTKKHFNYGVFDDLDATALELPYKDSDITMMIILPNKRTGLPELEKKLQNIDFSELSKNMYDTEVNVEIPKFKIEADIELNIPLQKMGMVKMFTDSAEFGGLLNGKEKLKISKVVHKAFIEVNEEGAEAAAATAIKVVAFSAIFDDDEKDFIVQHPFLFVIREAVSPLFIGRILKILY